VGKQTPLKGEGANMKKLIVIAVLLMGILGFFAPPDAAQQEAPKEIKQSVTKNGLKLAAHAHVQYNGAPQFLPISGTVISYASNTPLKIIHVGQVFYLSVQQVWLAAENPLGPWIAAPSVPAEVPAIVCVQMNFNPFDPSQLCALPRTSGLIYAVWKPSSM
jgi:hypothetical protein